MPELPEVETIARTLQPHIKGCVFSCATILKASTWHPLSLAPEYLYGWRVEGTRRRGKLLIIDLVPGSDLIQFSKKAESLELVIHLRMTGRLFTRPANELPDKHTRCLFDLSTPNGSNIKLFFNDIRTFGKILLATPDILSKWSFWMGLGPEPLEINVNDFSARLRGTRAIKAALLDQKVIAGIGNIYADESLFRAKIHPAKAAGSLSAAECHSLLSNLRKVLNLSISQCGSSIRDYRDANGYAGTFQNTFFAYGRAGMPCKICGNIMQKCRVAGRSTVFCPDCQKNTL